MAKDEHPTLPDDAEPARNPDPWTTTAHLDSWRGAVEWSHQQAVEGTNPVLAADPIELFVPLCALCGGIGLYQQKLCPECRA